MKKQILIITIVMSLMLISCISAGGITVSGPSSSTTGSTFQVSYQATGVSGNWGATVTSSISGGCTIGGKSTLNLVMLSDLPNPLTYTVQAPNSAATCTFSGDYKFGTDSVNQFNSYSVTIGSGGNVCNPITCGTNCGSIPDGCGGTLTCKACSVTPTPDNTNSSNTWCSIANNVNFLKLNDDSCTNGSILIGCIAGGLVLLLVLLK